jgi:hypothetical protein
VLGRADFTALLARHVPSAFTLKRRLASLLIERHRSQLRHLAATLGGEADDPTADERDPVATLRQTLRPHARLAASV